MPSLTTSMLPIEPVNWNDVLPTYPYRFYGAGYLFCVRCEHCIRLASFSNKEVCCSDCTNVLANSVSDNP